MSRSSAGIPADHVRVIDGSAGLSGLSQPAGVVLVVRGSELRVVQASASASALLGRPLESVLLAPLDTLGAELAAAVAAAAQAPASDFPVSFGVNTPGPQGQDLSFAGWVQRAGDELLVVDLLPCSTLEGDAARTDADEGTLLVQLLEDAIHGLSESRTLEELAARTAGGARAVCDYEEARVVRVDAEGQARLIASSRIDGSPHPVHWPAYLHAAGAWQPEGPSNERIQVLIDSHGEPAHLLPQGAQHPAGAPQDRALAWSTLRSPPPERLQQLRQAGVRAEASIVLLRDGRPWGVVVCLDSRRPRALAPARRLALELLAEAAATRITAIENASRAELSEQVRRLQRTLVESASRQGDWRPALQRSPELLLEPLQATSAVIIHDATGLPCGPVLHLPDPLALGRWIDARRAGAVWHDNDVPRTQAPPPQLLQPSTRMLAVRLSLAQPEFLVWFRAPDPATGERAADWSAVDLARAGAFGDMLIDLMVQVHAVRLLITAREFEHLRQTVAVSREAVVVCDEQGRTILVNQAFEQLAGQSLDSCRSTEDLLGCFQPAQALRRLIGQVRAEQRPGRSVLTLQPPDRPGLPVAVRAEPVRAPSGGLLGMIFIVEDLTARRHAEAAWTKLQALLGAPAREAAASAVDPVISALYTNASLAAMDMADTAHAPGITPLLQEVESATSRATALYRRLTRALRQA